MDAWKICSLWINSHEFDFLTFHNCSAYEIIKLIMNGKTEDAMGRYNGMKPAQKEEKTE